MKKITAGFIGFGLIGGSIARSLKELNSQSKLIAFNYNQDRINPNLQEALNDGTLDEITTYLSLGFDQCDIIFLCAPVLTNISYLKELKPIIKSQCILTDVGSVKNNIHQAVASLELEAQFIGGHPMAGSEKTGYQNSSSKLLENAFYILTPTKKTPESNTTLLYQLVRNMGSLPIILDAKEHDDITAAISHVPHIIAALLVNMIEKNDDEQEKMRTLAAGGFKDITRIASSSPIMWQNICLTNTESIKHFLALYRDSIDDFLEILNSMTEDTLLEIFQSAKDYRDGIPNQSKGIFPKVYEIYLDIADEPGAIATLATLLATNSISIKNIGILHNREFEDGVLRIELYDQDTTQHAISILKEHGYTIYER